MKQNTIDFICAVRKLNQVAKKSKVCTANERFAFLKKTPLNYPLLYGTVKLEFQVCS